MFGIIYFNQITRNDAMDRMVRNICFHFYILKRSVKSCGNNDKIFIIKANGSLRRPIELFAHFVLLEHIDLQKPSFI